MSERYGTVGELPELLAALEEFCLRQIADVTGELKAQVTASVYDVGRKDTYREVLDFIVSGD